MPENSDWISCSGCENSRSSGEKPNFDPKPQKTRNDSSYQSILSPIRLKRQELQNQIPYIIKVLREGTEKANKAANETLLEIKKAMGIDYFDNDNFEKEQIAKYAK